MEISVAFYGKWFWNDGVWGCRKRRRGSDYPLFLLFLVIHVLFHSLEDRFGSPILTLSFLLKGYWFHISQRNSDKTEAAGQGILEFCLLKIWEFVGRGFFIFSRISFKQHGSVFMCYTNIYAPILPVYAKVSHTGDLYTLCVCSFVSHGMIPEKKKQFLLENY